MSILEESTGAALQPMMGVFNNLVMYDQHIAKSSLETIVPDLATSWSWSEDGTELTFPLRQGVKWHDGKPFTAADAKTSKRRLAERRALIISGCWCRRSGTVIEAEPATANAAVGKCQPNCDPRAAWGAAGNLTPP